MSMSVRLETITPRKAALWLEQNNKNRPKRLVYVGRLAEAITNDEWRVNGETIKFNCNGDLIDGQHRLHAIVQAQKSIQTYVARGVEEGSFDTIDQGAPRKLGDVFARQGHKHYNCLAAAIRLMWLITEKSPGKRSGIRSAQGNEILEKNPGLHDCVAEMCRNAKTSHLPSSISAALYFLCAKKDAALASEFWHGVTTGEELRKSMPEFVLRHRLEKNKAEQKKLPISAVVAFSIKAWNAKRTGKKLALLKWVTDGLGKQAFPTIV